MTTSLIRAYEIIETKIAIIDDTIILFAEDTTSLFHCPVINLIQPYTNTIIATPATANHK